MSLPLGCVVISISRGRSLDCSWLCPLSFVRSFFRSLILVASSCVLGSVVLSYPDVPMKDVGNQKQPGSTPAAASSAGSGASNRADAKRRVQPTKASERVPKASAQGEEMGLNAVRSEEVLLKSTQSTDTGQSQKAQVQSLKVVRAQVVPPSEASGADEKYGTRPFSSMVKPKPKELRRQMADDKKGAIDDRLRQDKQHTETLHFQSTNHEGITSPELPVFSSDKKVETSSSSIDPTVEIQQLKNEVAMMQRSMQEEREHRQALCKENINLIRRVAALDAELTLTRSGNEASPQSSPSTEQRDTQEALRKENMHLTQRVKELDQELVSVRSGTWTPLSSLPAESDKITATMCTVVAPLPVESEVPESIGESTPTNTPTVAPSTTVATPVTGIHVEKPSPPEEKPTLSEPSSAKLATTDEIRFPGSTRSASPQHIRPFPTAVALKQPIGAPPSPTLPQRMVSCPTPVTPALPFSTLAISTTSPCSVSSLRSSQEFTKSVSRMPASSIEAGTALMSRYYPQWLQLEVVSLTDINRNSVTPPVALRRATSPGGFRAATPLGSFRGIARSLRSPQRSHSTDPQPQWGNGEVQSSQLGVLGMASQTQAGSGTNVAFITHAHSPPASPWHRGYGPSRGVIRYANEHNHASSFRQQPAGSGQLHQCASPGASARSLLANAVPVVPGSPHLTSRVRSSSQRRE